MPNAIGYVRRSSDKQEESLEQQRAKLEAFATARGWSLVHVYVDDAISGSDMKRPGLEQLMASAETRADVDVVIAWDRNRLARPKDAMDGMMLERRLLNAGKRVVYASTGQESDRSFASGLIGYVEHFQNGDYLRKLSRDTMRGLVSRVERGLWPGGPIPFGYDRLILGDQGKPMRIVRDLDNGSQAVLDVTSGEVVEQLPAGRRYMKQEHETCSLIPSEPARVRAVQKMFADYAAGVPSRKLRDWINGAGFRTSRGGAFTLPTILPILENPAYLGQCVYNRRTLSKWHRHTTGRSIERNDEGIEKRPEADWIVKADAWPAIIDAATFEAVKVRRQQSRLDNRSMSGNTVRTWYILSHIFTCGICGAKMLGQTTTSGKGYKTRYYTCSGHHRGHLDQCPKRYTVPAEVVEQHVLGLIRSDLVKLRDDDKLHQYVASEQRRLVSGDSDVREQLQRRLADLDQQSATIRDHLMSIDAATAKSLGLYEQARIVGEEHQAVEQQLAKLDQNQPTLPPAAEIRRRAAMAFDKLEAVLAGGTVEERRELVGLYVKTIKADPDSCEVRIGLYSSLFTSLIVCT